MMPCYAQTTFLWVFELPCVGHEGHGAFVNRTKCCHRLRTRSQSRGQLGDGWLCMYGVMVMGTRWYNCPLRVFSSFASVQRKHCEGWTEQLVRTMGTAERSRKEDKEGPTIYLYGSGCEHSRFFSFSLSHSLSLAPEPILDAIPFHPNAMSCHDPW